MVTFRVEVTSLMFSGLASSSLIAEKLTTIDEISDGATNSSGTFVGAAGFLKLGVNELEFVFKAVTAG